MNRELAEGLYNSARAHALSGNLLYTAALDKAVDANHPNPAQSVFNGIYSLSLHYLIGLSLELYLKSAYILHGGADDKGSLRAIGHKLTVALDAASELGFHTAAPNLREITEYLNVPYSQHYFRYELPPQVALPDVPDVYRAFQVLDDELQLLLFQRGDAAAPPR